MLWHYFGKKLSETTELRTGLVLRLHIVVNRKLITYKVYILRSAALEGGCTRDCSN